MLKHAAIIVGTLALTLSVGGCSDEPTTSTTGGDVGDPDVISTNDNTVTPDEGAPDAIPDPGAPDEGPPDATPDEGTPDATPQDVEIELLPPVGCADDQCDIGGECFDNEDANPDNPCQVCSVIVDRLDWSANDAGECDDDSACTSNDRCEEGACVGEPTVCDDGNACTDDICDDATGDCTFTNNTSPCLSTTPCNAAFCDAGACVQSTDPKDCDDGNPCTDDSCDDTIGCVNTPNALACDDGNACTENDICSGGLCGGTPRNCDDGSICTIDSCDADGNCVNTDLSAQCADDNVCTDEACDPVDGCVYPANTAACDDGSVCTENDVCAGGFCNGTPINLDDGNVCTTDLCDPVTGPYAEDNTLPCEDGSVCTLGDLCAGGACVPGGSSLNCDDGNACTDDACDPLNGCENTDNTDSCDDGTVCTENDVCSGGACGGDAIDCDDNNACTTDSCDPVNGCASTLIVSNGCRPVITIAYPPRGATITGDFANPVVTITGTVISGAGPITDFTINGDAVTVGGDGSFSYDMAAEVGGNIFEALATDSFGSANEKVQSFLWSDTFRKPDTPKNGITPDGMGIFLSQEVLDDGDHSLPADDLATIFELVLGSFDLVPFLPNPAAEGVGALGASYDAFIEERLDGNGNSLSVPGGTVSLVSQPGGLGVSIDMTGPSGNGIVFGFRAEKDACGSCFNPLNWVCCAAPGTITGDLTITVVAVDADMNLSVDANNDIVVTLSNVVVSIVLPDPAVTNLSADLFGIISGLINGAVDDLTSSLETEFETQLGTILAPLLGDAFRALAFNTSFDIPKLDGSGDVVSVQLVSDFNAVNFDTPGGQFDLRASGYSAAGQVTPYSNDGIPGRRMCTGAAQTMSLPNTGALEVGLADNVLNSILYAAWDGGLLEFPVPPSLLGGVDLSQFGVSNLDMNITGMLAPTAMDCNANGELIAHIGDLGVNATLELFGNPLTLEVWVSLTAGIGITAADGELGISLSDVQSIFTEVNVLEDAGVASEATFKNLIETELVGGLLGALGGSALGTIPLPSIDLSGLVAGLPPGTGFNIVINGLTRSGGNSIIDGDLAGN